MFVRLLPALFSLLFISAHFMRAYGNLFGSLFLLLGFTLFIRKSWIIRFWQTLLSFAAIIWVFTSINLINARIDIGKHWYRLAIILGAIVLFTAWSVYWFENKKIKKYYHPNSD